MAFLWEWNWPLIYLLAVSGVLLLSLLGGNRRTSGLAAILFASYCATNAAVVGLGHSHATLIIPTINALAAMSVAVLGLSTPSFAALGTFGLYLILILGVHLWAFVILRAPGSFPHYLAANVVFIAQLLLVGGYSVRDLIRSRPTPRVQRGRIGPARGHGVVEGGAQTAAKGRVGYDLATIYWRFHFAALGCPAVLRGHNGWAPRMVRRAAFVHCTASGQPERCLQNLHGRGPGRDCSQRCPHLRIRGRNPPNARGGPATLGRAGGALAHS